MVSLFSRPSLGHDASGCLGPLLDDVHLPPPDVGRVFLLNSPSQKQSSAEEHHHAFIGQRQQRSGIDQEVLIGRGCDGQYGVCQADDPVLARSAGSFVT